MDGIDQLHYYFILVTDYPLNLHNCCFITIVSLGPVSELNVDNWNDNCEAKSEAKSPRPLRGLQVDFSLLRGQIII